MKFDRTSASYVALVACAIAFLAFLYLRYGRQPNAGNQPDVLSRMAFELSVWQTIAAIAALVVSAVGVIISMNAALDARDIAAQSRLDAATDRARLEKEAAAERVRVYREAEQRRIDNHNRLIANAAKIGETVATACERFAVLYAAGRKPKWNPDRSNGPRAGSPGFVDGFRRNWHRRSRLGPSSVAASRAGVAKPNHMAGLRLGQRAVTNAPRSRQKNQNGDC